MNFTPSQQKAIDLSGDSLLVSAAAGAGKTAVLTARVLRILSDKDHPCDADRLMILTFTNAAADEMRKRITDNLREAIKKDPHNEHLKRQLLLLPCAKICTIDSACLDIVRQNFSVLGLDPQFSVVDQNKNELMKADALEDFIEQLYERADTDSEVLNVIKYFADGKTDSKLYSALFYGSEFLLKEPWPEEYIERVCHITSDNVFESAAGSQELIIKKISDILIQYKSLLNMISIFGNDNLTEFYECETENIRTVLIACEKGDFDKAVEIAKSFVFKRYIPCPKKDVDKELWDWYKDIRSDLKDKFNKICAEFLYADSSTVLNDRRDYLPMIRKYLELCMEFNGILANKRKAQRLLSFDDIEKYALSLLVKNSSGEKTELAHELSQNIEEIIVDEYQDCNTLQETIFNALSKDGKNVFTVGDVKQSIYGFRGAEPSLFVKKQNSSAYPETDILTFPSKISLRENFRSHPEVLRFVNAVFDPLMTVSRGGIEYNPEHRLESGGLYGDTDKSGVDIMVVVPDGKPNKLSKAEMEAEAVAKKIKSIIGTQTIYDLKEGRERFVRAEDIAILMNTPKTSGSIFEKALEKQGIGCINNNPSEKYLDTPEVRDILAYLQVIDNPYNDIPLVTLMYSDYFGFSAEELGRLRAANKRSLFYDAVREYAKVDNKTAAFIERIESLRTLTLTTDVYGIISEIYESSGILLKLASRKEGESARANLLMLSDFASEFEASRYKGLFAFINYILKLIEKDSTIPAAKLRKSDGCVNILSIHRSKGLEYPIVFLANAADALIFKTPNEIMFSKEMVGATVKDNKNHRHFSSFYRNIVSNSLYASEIHEYIRLLYVALTRACSWLYITGCCGIMEFTSMAKSAYVAHGVIPDDEVLTAPSFLKWILLSVIASKDATPIRAFTGLPIESEPCDVKFQVSIEVPTEDEQTEEEHKAHEYIEADTEHIRQMISRRYIYESDTLVPAKMSVSEIKTMHTDITVTKRPAFMQGGTDGRDRGNATHSFLQYADFDVIKDRESLDTEINRLVDDEFITANDAQLIECDKVLRFLTDDTMKKLRENSVCKKEERFVFGLPANEIMDTDSRQAVTVQGIIDCLFIKDGRAVILDYKTDRVKDAQTLIDRYSVQLDMYERALYELEGIQTDSKYIYSFALEKFIKL